MFALILVVGVWRNVICNSAPMHNGHSLKIQADIQICRYVSLSIVIDRTNDFCKLDKIHAKLAGN